MRTPWRSGTSRACPFMFTFPFLHRTVRRPTELSSASVLVPTVIALRLSLLHFLAVPHPLQLLELSSEALIAKGRAVMDEQQRIIAAACDTAFTLSLGGPSGPSFGRCLVRPAWDGVLGSLTLFIRSCLPCKALVSSPWEPHRPPPLAAAQYAAPCPGLTLSSEFVDLGLLLPLPAHAPLSSGGVV